MCRFESDYPHHSFEKQVFMKILATLFCVLLAVAACEPDSTKVSEAAPSSGAELGIEEHVWVAEDIGGKGVIDNSHIVLTLNAGNASGKSGCNSYRGSYSLSGDQLSFGPMMSTRMACAAEAMMKQERDYLEVLSKVTSYDRGDGGALILKTTDGKKIRFMAE